ncbi:MAG: TonB-dependent receptor [Tannerellaceae bacterium]|jgi:TonB-linked SusC/RagA family outer membrane protein|nr:TonB-dependent receptor [Tannerellaceae bacterium]
MKNKFEEGRRLPFSISKLARKMKVLALFALLAISSLQAADSYAQKATINLKASSVTLREAIRAIEKQTEFVFFYNNDYVDLNKKVSFDIENGKITDVLSQISEDYSYVIEDKQILLIPRTQQQQQQGKLLTGLVVDQNGEPVVGANITIKGTSIGQISDVDGKFAMQIPANTVLVVSYIGYTSQEIEVGNKTNLRITLSESALGLDEVVVIGYGSVKKSDLTGSVANVLADNSNVGGASASVGQMIQGRVAGLTVQQGSSQPGGGNTIIIRGRNSIYGSVSPLYIVDGFPYNEVGSPDSGENFKNAGRDPLNFINPNDIEAVSVLKDAAATAIYGTRGANGVVVITTKKGKAGKMKVTYDGYAGIQEQAKKYDLLTGSEYMTYWSQFEQGPTYTAEEIAQASTTNWIDEITQQGHVQSHQINLSSAEKYLRYYFSAAYYEQTGIIKNAGIKRLSARSNVDYQREKLSIFTNASFTNINDLNQADEGGTRNSIIESALCFAPNLQKPADGSYLGDVGSNFNIYPLSALGIEDQTNSNKTSLNISAEYEVLPGLKPQIKAGYDVQDAFRTYFMPSTTPYNGGLPNNDGRFHGGRASASNVRNINYTLEGLLNYTHTFAGDLKLIALLGYSYQFQGWNGNRTKGQEFSPIDIFGPNNMGSAQTQFAETWKGENIIISGFGRVDLTWKDRYFLTGTLRRDGVSKFGENNKWGWFPGLSAAWKLNNEGFLSDVETIDLLKVRAGWGVTGNSGFNNYLSQSLYNVVKENGAIIGQNILTATQLSSTLANPNLKWETTAQFNLGIDLSAYQRYGLSLDVYRKKTSNLIIPMPLPVESGLSQQWVNAADFEVLGVELSLDGKIIHTDNFDWSANFTFGWNNNKVSKINISGDAAQSSLESIGIIEGEKPRSYFMYQFKEVDENGSLTFYDLNGDRSVNVKDRKVVGNPDPDVTLGLSNTLRYRNVELEFFFNSALGQELHNYHKADHASAYLAHPRNLFRSVLTEANLPIYNVAVGGDYTNNSRWVEDASYLRLRNLTLSYLVPSALFKDKIQNLRLYIQGQNLLTFTGYTGVDPESTTLYPSVRTLTGGLSITF